MSSVKISSIYEIKHEIARLVRVVKRKTKLDAFNPTIQNHLIELVKVIKPKIRRPFRVNVYIYDDEYTLNYFTDKVRWTVGVAEDGMVNYVYLDKSRQIFKGRFLVNEVPEEFYNTLDKLNENV